MYIGSRSTLKGNLARSTEQVRKITKRGSVNVPLNTVVHKDTEIISQERAGNSELPGRSNDKQLAEAEENSCDISRVRLGDNGELWLVLQGLVIPDEMLSNSAKSAKVGTYKWSRNMPKEKIITARKYVPALGLPKIRVIVLFRYSAGRVSSLYAMLQESHPHHCAPRCSMQSD